MRHNSTFIPLLECDFLTNRLITLSGAVGALFFSEEQSPTHSISLHTTTHLLHADTTQYHIHSILSGQRKSLALSRALLSLSRDVILLESPCDALSEAQERTFFQLLRAEMKGSGKVVILTASRFATAIHADRVLVMVDGRVGQEGTYKELISKPGPFRDQLYPPV